MQKADKPGFGHIDLRGLHFLAEVLKWRNVTRAGAAAGLSQPAASRLLAQLRRALGGDPLLVRKAGGGYALTARATELLPMLDEAIATATRLFAAPTFDPSTSTRRFRIATTDYGAAVVVSAVAESIARHAPGVGLHISGWDRETLSGLEDGSIDLALYTDEALPAGFHHQPLFEERFACLVRHDHPVLAHRDESGRIAPSRLAELPRVVLSYPDGDAVAIDDTLADYGRARGNGDIVTPYFLSAPLLLIRSNRVLCMARRAAELVAGMAELALVDLPEAGEITYCTIWHERTSVDAGAAWMRQLMARCMEPPPHPRARQIADVPPSTASSTPLT